MLDRGRELDPDQAEARRCLGFLHKPNCGDYLLYPHQPDRGNFTIVTVTGDYDYAADGEDFRSFRPCAPVTPDAISAYDPVVPTHVSLLRDHSSAERGS